MGEIDNFKWGIGCVVMLGDIVGVVTKDSGAWVTVAGSTGKDYTWNKESCTPIVDRSLVLQRMEEAILNAHS